MKKNGGWIINGSSGMEEVVELFGNKFVISISTANNFIALFFNGKIK